MYCCGRGWIGRQKSLFFEATELNGAFKVRLDCREDHRGFFARTWCRQEFEEAGLNPNLVQANLSYNRSKGTLRGLHYQVEPYAEAKFIRCSRGSIYDVIVDLRKGSQTFMRWIGVELKAEDYTALYVPEGFAHGFQTLKDDTEALYYVSEFYTPLAERGIRYDDPAIGVTWPFEVGAISAVDESWPNFQPDRKEVSQAR